jgi:CDGSH-type Zn-finger protein
MNVLQLQPCSLVFFFFKNKLQTKKTSEMAASKITMKQNGPIILQGNFTLTHSNGNVETIEKTAALCRCGASSKKPFCDGAHGKTGFKG